MSYAAAADRARAATIHKTIRPPTPARAVIIGRGETAAAARRNGTVCVLSIIARARARSRFVRNKNNNNIRVQIAVYKYDNVYNASSVRTRSVDEKPQTVSIGSDHGRLCDLIAGRKKHIDISSKVQRMPVNG